jgi:hypothetical protein
MSIPEIENKKYEKDGISHVEDICPDGWVVVDTYHPTHSITPWDYHGGKHQRQYRKVISDAGVESIALQDRKTIVHPTGSGSGGRVRFGDNMMPHTYMIAVASDDVGKAHKAMNDHKEAIQKWLHENGPIPEACRS